jgi:DNA uptake protein ComE-like DNA-binding protein
MKKFKLFLVLLLFWQFPYLAKAQSDEEQLKKLEKYLENTDQAVDYNDLIDQVNYSSTNKINLNKVTPFELLSLNFLTPFQARAIIKHRMEYGDFVSTLEAFNSSCHYF